MIKVRKGLITKVLLIFTTLVITGCPKDPKPPIPVPPLGRVIAYDLLGAQHPLFKVTNLTSYFKKPLALGNLDNTFGSDISDIRSLLNDFHPTYYRVHLINGPCIRNKQCGNYEIGAGYTIQSFDAAIKAKNQRILGYIKARANVYKSLSLEFPTTKFLLSVELEHNLSIESFRILADAAKSVWPEVQLVNNAVNGHPQERYAGAWLERHGKNPHTEAEITSLDGESVFDIDTLAWLERTKNNKITFVWWGGLNCRTDGDFIDPRIRHRCPANWEFEQAAWTLDNPPPPASNPSLCRSVSPFRAPEIVKTQAEDGGTGDLRADLPVIITDYQNSSVNVITYKGQKVGSLGFYGNYPPNLKRHYSGFNGSRQPGIWFEKEALRLSGNRWTYLEQNGRCKGPVLMGRRNGQYR